MADKGIIARLQIVGGTEARAEIDQTTRAAEAGATRMQSAFERIGAKTESVESGFKKLNRGVNDARGAIELIGGAVPGLDGVFGGLVRTIGNLGDVFGTVSALFLKNPIGLAAAGISAAAAAFLLLSKNAEAATVKMDAAAKSAAAAAIDYTKMIDPLKTVAGLLDQVKAKQVDALGGPRNVVDIDVQARRERLVALRRELAAAEATAAPDARGRETDSRPIQEQFAADIAAQQLRAKAAADARAKINTLKPEIAKIEAEIQRLEIEEARLRILEGAAKETPGDKGTNLEGLREGRAGLQEFNERASKAGAEAAAEERRQIDALLTKYAPALQAETELATARERAVELLGRNKISAEQFEAVISSIAEAEFKATEAGKARIDLEEYAKRIVEDTTTAQERYAEAIKKTTEAQEAGLITAEQAARKTKLESEKLEKATRDTSEAARNQKKFAQDLGLTFTSAFENAVVGGRKLRDVLQGLGQDLLKIAVRKTLTEPLLELFGGLFGADDGKKSSGGGLLGGLFGSIFGGGGKSSNIVEGDDPLGGIIGSVFKVFGFARGGAFDRGDAVPFASGSVVTRPTLFNMRGGRGLMGEAGPEAILPLQRDRSGRLGVAAAGGGGPAVNITIDARGAVHGEAQRIRAVVMRDLAPILTEASVLRVEQRANLGGSFSRAVGRRGRA